MTTTAKRLKEAMKLRNMKQSDLVKKSGISKGALSSYLNGHYEPKQNNIYKLANALHVNEAWLMGHDMVSDKYNDDINERDQIINKRIRFLIEFNPELSLNIIAILCRNKRIELDLTEKDIAETSKIAKDDYVSFELHYSNISITTIVKVLKYLFGTDLSKISAYISGFILDTLESENKPEFLKNLGYSDSEINIIEKIYLNNQNIGKELGSMVLASENEKDVKFVDILYKSSIELFPSLYKKK